MTQVKPIHPEEVLDRVENRQARGGWWGGRGTHGRLSGKLGL